jgi:two-component system response regulator DesR
VEPGLLICSIDMPEMSGIELAARVTAARPRVRVLLLAVDPGSVERARERSPLVRGVLLKPFTTDELCAAAAVALAGDP